MTPRAHHRHQPSVTNVHRLLTFLSTTIAAILLPAATDTPSPHDEAEAAFQQGYALLKEKQFAQAVVELERATTLAPNSARYYLHLGNAYGQCGLQASFFRKPAFARQCLAAYERGVAADPDFIELRVARFQFFRDVPALAGGGREKAEAELEEIRRRDPITSATQLSDWLIMAKRVPEAFTRLEQLAAAHPEQKFHLYLIGRLSALSGTELERGASALREYLQTSPTGAEPPLAAAHWRLGLVYEHQHNTAAARTELEAALALAPDFTLAREALTRLP